MLATCISWVAGLRDNRSGHSSISLGVVTPHATKLKISCTIFCLGIATIRRKIKYFLELGLYRLWDNYTKTYSFLRSQVFICSNYSAFVQPLWGGCHVRGHEKIYFVCLLGTEVYMYCVKLWQRSWKWCLQGKGGKIIKARSQFLLLCTDPKACSKYLISPLS